MKMGQKHAIPHFEGNIKYLYAIELSKTLAVLENPSLACYISVI